MNIYQPKSVLTKAIVSAGLSTCLLGFAPVVARADDASSTATTSADTTATENTKPAADAAATDSAADASATATGQTDPAEPSIPKEIEKAESSNQGSYTTTNKYQLHIKYVDAATGKELQPTVYKAYEQGASYSITSPDIAGYVLVDASQQTVSGVIDGANHNIELTVTYKNITAAYKVITRIQADTGSAYIETTEIKYAIAGSGVSEVPANKAGYVFDATKSTTTTLVKADGTSQIVLT